MMREFLAKANPKHRKYFTTLRSALLALPETEESIEIDEIEGEWCPVYRVRDSDLVWVHFDERLWVSFPVEQNFEKKVTQDESLDEPVIEAVKEAEDTGGIKIAKMGIRSNEDVDQIVPLLRLRHSMLMS
jgi:hypothetical protein